MSIVNGRSYTCFETRKDRYGTEEFVPAKHQTGRTRRKLHSVKLAVIRAAKRAAAIDKEKK